MTRQERINLGLAPDDGPHLDEYLAFVPPLLFNIFAVIFLGAFLLALLGVIE